MAFGLNGTVLSNASSTILANELGGGNLTYGAAACNDDYTNVINADYSTAPLVAGNTDYVTTLTNAAVWSTAAQPASNGVLLYGVHATPLATNPSTPGVIITWMTGLPTMGPIATVWPSGTPPATGTGGAFAATGANNIGNAFLATSSQSSPQNPTQYTAFTSPNVTAIQYLRNFTATNSQTGLFTPAGGPFPYTTQNVTNYNTGGANYTNFCYLSGYIFHATITGLAPDTKYYYIVGNAAGYSTEFSFTTPPGPSGSSGVYPMLVGLIADVGQTTNTSTGLGMLAGLNPQVVLNVGDLTYADVYKPCNTTFNFQQFSLNNQPEPWTAPDDKSTCQLRWDTFLAVPGTKQLFGSALVVNAPGNHEVRREAC